MTFVPHLVPLDQGELVSCYVHAATRRSTSTRSSRRPTRDEPFVELADAPARRARRARHELLPHPRALSTSARARSIVFAAIDNLWKGAASQAVQNLNLMFGLDETAGLAVSALLRLALGRRARARARGAAPAGCRRASAPPGVAAGLKPSGGADVGLLVSDARDDDERRALHALGRARRAGAADAERCAPRRAARRGRQLRQRERRDRPARPRRRRRACRAPAAMAAGVEPTRVAVASTGVIGVPLDAGEVVARARPRARGELRPDGDGDFSAAIMTTDAFEKRAALEVELSGGTVRLCAQAKGAGMIPPRVRDDAVLRADRRRAARPRPPTCCSASA